MIGDHIHQQQACWIGSDANAHYKITLMKFNADVLECDGRHPLATQCTNKLTPKNLSLGGIELPLKQENWIESTADELATPTNRRVLSSSTQNNDFLNVIVHAACPHWSIPQSIQREN